MHVPPGFRIRHTSRNRLLGLAKLSRPDETTILSYELDSYGNGPSTVEISNDLPEAANRLLRSPISNTDAPSGTLLLQERESPLLLLVLTLRICMSI